MTRLNRVNKRSIKKSTPVVDPKPEVTEPESVILMAKKKRKRKSSKK